MKVAIAGSRGSRCRPDGGTTWREAELETALWTETWRPQRFPFERGDGAARVDAHATDDQGREQAQVVADPLPSGASAYDGATDGP